MEKRTTSFSKGERVTAFVNTSLPPNLYKIETCFDVNKRKKKGILIGEKLNKSVRIKGNKD